MRPNSLLIRGDKDNSICRIPSGRGARDELKSSRHDLAGESGSYFSPISGAMVLTWEAGSQGGGETAPTVAP